jgi:hypothetical protein
MSDTTTIAVKQRPAQALKTFLNAKGDTVEIDGGATSFSYKAIADGKTYVYDMKSQPAEVILMFALFGASTLGTNTGSQNRQAEPGDQFKSDADAVEARFARIQPGDWGTKAGGGGFQIDVDILYDAIVKAHGRTPPDVAAYKATLAQDAAVCKTLRNHKDVAPLYDAMIRERRLAGVEQKDLGSLLGF